MTHEEAVDVLDTIKEIYPMYNLTIKKARIYIPQLKRMDYEKVMDKLSSYSAIHAFPPMIADIAVFAPEENPRLKVVQQWREEASEVTDEMRHQFWERLEQLLKGVSER